jgi:hypothetical protein
MLSRVFLLFRTLLITSIVFTIALTLQGCGGGSSSSGGVNTGDITIDLGDEPSVFFFFTSKKETDASGKDTYYSFVGESIGFPQHIFSNSEHTPLDVSQSYWADSLGNTIQDDNNTIQLTDSHQPAVKACMIPTLSNGKVGDLSCVTFEVRSLPGSAQKLRKISLYADNDHFQAGMQLSELEPNDIRSTEGTIWEYRWFDNNSDALQKDGDVITGYKLDYADIDVGIRTIKVCVFEIATQQCVKESTLETVPSNNVPTVTVLDIIGEYKQGGTVSPESRTSYAFTQPAADFTYEWAVAGVVLLDYEKTASELVLKDASYFEKDITVCIQRAYKNFTGTGTTLTNKDCKTKQFTESDVQVTPSYSYGHNLLVQGAPLVFSGQFNGLDEIDYSTFMLRYQGQLLTQGSDYTLTTFGHNDFTFNILSQFLAPTTEYGPIMTLQCEFTYNNKVYSCLGGSSPSNISSVYTTGGLPKLAAEVVGNISEKNRVAFKRCDSGDKLTWWVKDKATEQYVQQGLEEVIGENTICHGNAAAGSFYINESMAGKILKLVVKRARNGLVDERIQVLNIELGEISK